MSTVCTNECGTIGQAPTNAELKAAILGRYTQTGTRYCDQLREMLGCYVPESREGFVRIIRIGPRGPEIEQTNPPDPNLRCPHGNQKARKVGEICTPSTGGTS